MYTIKGLPDPHPYRHTGRVFLSKEGKEYYDIVNKAVRKDPPSWVEEYVPGDWIRIFATYRFKNRKKFPDPNNMDICLVNAVMFALQKFNPKIDDAYILVHHNVPEFTKSDGVEFTLEHIRGSEDAALRI